MLSHNFFLFVEAARRARYGIMIPPAIADRWRNRVILNNWHQFSDGADLYLSRYGKNIGPDKLIWLALCAEGNLGVKNDYRIAAIGDDKIEPREMTSNPFAMTMWKTAYLKGGGPPCSITSLANRMPYREIVIPDLTDMEKGNKGKKGVKINTDPKPKSRFELLEVEEE